MRFTRRIPRGFPSLPDWREIAKSGIDALKRWVVAYLEKTTFEISVPALRDASLAPEGKTGLIVSTLFDYDLTRYFEEAGEYQALKDLAQQTILGVLDQSILPGLIAKTEFALCSTPADHRAGDGRAPRRDHRLGAHEPPDAPPYMSLAALQKRSKRACRMCCNAACGHSARRDCPSRSSQESLQPIRLSSV